MVAFFSSWRSSFTARKPGSLVALAQAGMTIPAWKSLSVYALSVCLPQPSNRFSITFNTFEQRQSRNLAQKFCQHANAYF